MSPAAVRTPALARLRRIRWSMTALFALTTALCLAALAVVASRIDSDSRSAEVSAEVRTRALALARTAYYDAGRLHLEYLSDDRIADGAKALAVVEDSVLVYSEPNDAATPTRAELARIYRRVQQTQDAIVVTTTSRTGTARRWAAAPVWNDDVIGAIVLVGADPAAGEAGHDRLVSALLLGSLALVLVSAFAAHALSGRAMRPAVQSLAQQEQFLTEAAHELRTPLTTLRIVVEDGQHHPERSAASLADATGLVLGLNRLVEGLLSKARLRSGTLVVEQDLLRLDQLVEQVVDDMPDADGVVVTGTPTVVRGDADLLAQAVRNLVDNGLRHGGGSVAVEVGSGTVVVSDRGPGLGAHLREQAFDSGVSFGGSTGMGLSIVSWVAELHGGSADLADSSGGGLRASLSLPEAR